MKKNIKLASVLSTTIVFFLFVFCMPLHSEVVVYEPFDYPSGGLNGQSGSTEIGLDGTWNANSSAIVDVNDLNYGILPTTGHSIGGMAGGNNHFGGSRTISTSALAANGLLDDGATLWFSVIMGYDTGGNVTNSRLCLALANDQFNGGNYNYWINDDGAQLGSGVGVMLGRINGTNGRVVASQFRDAASGDGLEGVVYGGFTGSNIYSSGDHGMIVGKIVWGATPGAVDAIQLYQPTELLLELDAPISTLEVNVDQSTFDTLTWSRGDKVVMDEIRFGSTLDDVIGGGQGDGIAAQIEIDLLDAFAALKGHIMGSETLDPNQIVAHKATIDLYKQFLGYNDTIISASFDYVLTYDSVMGPLWVDGVQRWPGWDRRLATEDDIDWVTYHIMQYIVDWTYTDLNMSRYENLLGSFKFGSADHFPGHADPPADQNAIYSVTINGSFPKTYGHNTMHWTSRPARKCTGAYAAPGTIATVTVPPSMVNAGYQIRVGAHALDLSNRPFYKRLGRSSVAYDITSTLTKVANPLGGGIYIEVPYLASAGVVDIQIKNAIRGPYYSYNTVTGHITSLSEWQNTELKHPAPWADFQSEKFMMQVPTSWIAAFNENGQVINTLDDPVTMMADWDKAMDICNDLMGFDHDRGKETSYDQVDVLIDAGVYSPGYPTCNNTYNPWGTYNGNSNSYLVRGPQYAPSMHFHELGHGYLFQKFSGETESAVNLLHVPVWNRKFGYDLDTAFRASAFAANNTYRTLDTTAITWMMSRNFKNNLPMVTKEKQYQLKGHAKFVEIARQFGWAVLGDYWRSFNEDYENGISWSGATDSLLLRLCKAVGYDIRPLFHFWGIYPSNPVSLQADIEAQNIPASNRIYDILVKYKSFVPADNSAYQEFAFNWWQRQPDPAVDPDYITELDHALLWDTYDQNYAELIRSNVQYYIDLYFPDGRPGIDAGPDMITWSAEPVQLNAGFTGGYVPSSFSWIADPVDGVAFSPNPNIQNPIVTVSKDTSNPSSVTFTLTTDGSGGIIADEMIIDVYDNPCNAALASGTPINPVDLDGNCVIDLNDFTIMAATWLNNNSMQVPEKKQ